MVARAGAGPEPIPFKTLTAENLAAGIKIALSPSAKLAAEGLAGQICKEEGVEKAVDGFYRLLPLKRMRCSLYPDRIAIWQIPESIMGISSLVAGVLHSERILDLNSLKLSRHKDYDTENQQVTPSLPLSGIRPPLIPVGSNYRLHLSSNRIRRRPNKIPSLSPHQPPRRNPKTSNIPPKSNSRNARSINPRIPKYPQTLRR
jgi:hypothetical protein